MAKNESHSMNADLAEGMSDGCYKKIVTDRANAERTTYDARRDLNDTWFGIHEAAVKHLPDGTTHITPDFVTSPLAHLP